MDDVDARKSGEARAGQVNRRAVAGEGMEVNRPGAARAAATSDSTDVRRALAALITSTLGTTASRVTGAGS